MKDAGAGTNGFRPLVAADRTAVPLLAPASHEGEARIKQFKLLPGMKVETRVAGIVRWTKPEGLGIQFGAMGARETYALTELLASRK